MSVRAFKWTTAERRAWKPRPRLKPSEWAERYRRLTRAETATPGKWRNDRAPHLRAIMDIPTRPGIAEVVVMKAAQVGGSEAFRNLMGCWSDQDPDPMGIMLADRDMGRKVVDGNIIPLYRRVVPLRSKLTGKSADIQKGQIKLVDHAIYLMWAGSAASASTRPMRFAMCDEVDKYPSWVGKESDPISLVRKRTVTYEDRARLIIWSTPTTKTGPVAQAFERCTLQLYYYVPCPACGVYQRLVFPQIKWDKPEGLEGKALADHVEGGGHCWYECAHCQHEIREADKPAMTRAGKWRTEDGTVDDIEAIDRFPPGTRVGFQIASWYANWVTFAEVAAEFILAKGNLEATFNFYTQTCGEPFEQRIKKATSGAFSQKSETAALPEGVIPSWAVRLIATIDTQHDHFWLVIRAWGPNLRSQRVYHGRVASFADLERLCWGTPWAVEDEAFAPKTCDVVMIDSGGTRKEGEESSRTMEVYTWCMRTRRAVPIKGQAESRRGSTYFWPGEGFIKRIGNQKPLKIDLWHIATHHFNDQLQALIDDEEEGQPERWALNKRNDPEYNSHMSSVQKTLEGRGATRRETWVPVSAGARIDYRDCEVYQVAAAYWLNVHLLPSAEEIAKARAVQAKAVRRVERKAATRGGFTIKPLTGYL